MMLSEALAAWLVEMIITALHAYQNINARANTPVFSWCVAIWQERQTVLGSQSRVSVHPQISYKQKPRTL
jgi:hypothetical protein